LIDFEKLGLERQVDITVDVYNLEDEDDEPVGSIKVNYAWEVEESVEPESVQVSESEHRRPHRVINA